MILRSMFGRKWILATLLVLAGTALCIRLGIWQLHRLQQRRVFNAQVNSMRAQPPLDLNTEQPADIDTMEWRPVQISGTFDFENQVALRNQYNGSAYGYHLVTPLRISDGEAVLVDRGWISADGNSAPSDWRKYDEKGTVKIVGQIRLGSGKPAFGGIDDPPLESGQTRIDLWNNFDLVRISRQIPYKVLPIYVQPDVEPDDVNPPIPFQPELDLSEGPHQGYALQWFTFATILFVGYPFYLKKQEAEGK